MAFSEELIQQVWEKGRAVNDRDGDEWRKDECGAWIHRSSYGNPTNEFGWTIRNVSPGGEDVLNNLRPFHRQNDFNRNTGAASCTVIADRQGIPSTAQLSNPGNRES